MAVSTDEDLCTDVTDAAVAAPSLADVPSDVRWHVLVEPDGDELGVPDPDSTA